MRLRNDVEGTYPKVQYMAEGMIAELIKYTTMRAGTCFVHMTLRLSTTTRSTACSVALLGPEPSMNTPKYLLMSFGLARGMATPGEVTIHPSTTVTDPKGQHKPFCRIRLDMSQ